MCKEWKFNFLLADLDAFIPLCCLIAEAMTFNSILNNSGENGHPCFVPDLRGKAHPLRMILAVDLSYMLLSWGKRSDLEVWSFYTYFIEGSYQERMLYFVKCFLCICGEHPVVLVLSFIDAMNHMDWFADVEPALHSRFKSHLVVVNNSFNVLLDPVG